MNNAVVEIISTTVHTIGECEIKAAFDNVHYNYKTDKNTLEKIMMLYQVNNTRAVIKELKKIKKYNRLYSIPKVGDKITINGEPATIKYVEMNTARPGEKVPFIGVEEIPCLSFNWQMLEQLQ